jgi:hypothetical protein
MSATNGSRILTVPTPSGEVQITRLRRQSDGPNGQGMWVARRRGDTKWRRGASAREVIGRATQLKGGAWPGWLAKAAENAEQELNTLGEAT